MRKPAFTHSRAVSEDSVAVLVLRKFLDPARGRESSVFHCPEMLAPLKSWRSEAVGMDETYGLSFDPSLPRLCPSGKRSRKAAAAVTEFHDQSHCIEVAPW